MLRVFGNDIVIVERVRENFSMNFGRSCVPCSYKSFGLEICPGKMATLRAALARDIQEKKSAHQTPRQLMRMVPQR
jgi:hypothetical protein